MFDCLGQRYAEKCDFEEARTNFKVLIYVLHWYINICSLIPGCQIARDLRESNRTPRYASSVPLLRTHGDELSSRSMDLLTRTRPVPVNSTQAEIGSDLARSHLLDGRKLALQKIPISSFGLKDQRDVDAMRGLKDYTYFGGRHEGAETRVFIPPSLGWKAQMELDERDIGCGEGVQSITS